jgi:2-hydroxy-6-oxonona-2,4-dienedioate hydrolase
MWTSVRTLAIHARAAAPASSGTSPAVLVHGVGVSSRYMVPTVRELGKLVPTYAPDLPGFGRSDKPRAPLTLSELAEALREWIDAVGLRKPALIGNSFGCQIIVELATRWPNALARAVLQGPTVDPAARTWPRQILRWFRNAPHERVSQAPLIALDYWDSGLRRVIATFNEALRDPIDRKLPLMTAPTLVVRGERDPIVPRDWAEEVVALLPRGRLVTIPGAAHTLNYAAPEPFVRAIAPFLLGTEGRVSA